MPSLPAPQIAPAAHIAPPSSSDYYPQPFPILDPTGIVSPNPIWNSALAYQYGPYPDQRLWVFVPPDPSGSLDLIVHAGGFRHGSPTSVEIDGFAQLDLSRGTTVVSIGYRLLNSAAWPAPIDDIATGIDDGYQIAQNLSGNRITDVTETGLSAGGTALALINYSPSYPTTTVRPSRLITISAPLETDASSPAKPLNGFRYTSALRWDGVTPKARIPITLMGTHGDPVAIESGRVSTIGEFSRYLRMHGVRVATYFDPHGRGNHGSIAGDFLLYPDVESALLEAYAFGSDQRPDPLAPKYPPAPLE
jgi:acetyl esterase/lipase